VRKRGHPEPGCLLAGRRAATSIAKERDRSERRNIDPYFIGGDAKGLMRWREREDPELNETGREKLFGLWDRKKVMNICVGAIKVRWEERTGIF